MSELSAREQCSATPQLVRMKAEWETTGARHLRELIAALEQAERIANRFGAEHPHDCRCDFCPDRREREFTIEELKDEIAYMGQSLHRLTKSISGMKGQDPVEFLDMLEADLTKRNAKKESIIDEQKQKSASVPVHHRAAKSISRKAAIDADEALAPVNAPAATLHAYHRTFDVKEILARGFEDAEGYYGTNQLRKGVWLSDRPLDDDEGGLGDALFVLDLPKEVFARHEWPEEGKSYRESLIPAEIVNRYGPPRVMNEQS